MEMCRTVLGLEPAAELPYFTRSINWNFGRCRIKRLGSTLAEEAGDR